MQPGHLSSSSIVTGLIFAAVIGLRLWRMGVFRKNAPARRLRLEYLWIMPAIMAAAAVALLAQAPPQGSWQGLVLALTAAAGAALGWWRGTLIRIEVDRETHALNTRNSPAALIFLLAVFVLRFAARYLLAEASQTLHLATALITDGFVLFAAGLFGVSRLEMWLRARRLLAEARASGAQGLLADPGREAQAPKIGF